MDYVSKDDLTVNMRDLAGVSHTDEDEVMRVSMITADVSQGNTNSHSNNSQGIQVYVCPERGKQRLESTTSMYRSEFYHREEDYYDWHYDTAPIVPGITAD